MSTYTKQHKTVKYSIKNNIAYVELARPEKHNAINMAMFTQLDKLIKQLAKNKSLRAVIVSGQGEDFSTGLDIKSVLKSPINAIKLLFKWLPGNSNLAQRVSTGWRSIPCPVIMVLHGRVWGGGLQIALGGDFRLASKDCQLSIMESRWGLIPDMGGTLALKEHLKVDQAKLLAITAKQISAEQALNFGLVTEVHQEPMVAAIALANEINKQSPDSVAGVKKLYDQAWYKPSRWTLAKESLYQIKIISGKNQQIKSYNQLNIQSEKPKKTFKNRQHW